MSQYCLAAVCHQTNPGETFEAEQSATLADTTDSKAEERGLSWCLLAAALAPQLPLDAETLAVVFVGCLCIGVALAKLLLMRLVLHLILLREFNLI